MDTEWCLEGLPGSVDDKYEQRERERERERKSGKSVLSTLFDDDDDDDDDIIPKEKWFTKYLE